MSLLQRLADELKTAMRSKDSDRVGALRLLKSAIGYAEIERKTDRLPDGEIVAVVQREAKKRRDAIEQFEKAGRTDLVAKERNELRVLEDFLPAPFSPDELEALVRSTIQEEAASSKKEMGRVIKAAQAKAAGRADGKAISSVVARLLPQ